MDSTVENLWQCYLEAERICFRKQTRLAMDRFIDALLALPEEEWQSWALMTARQVIDEEKDIPVRFPLFRRVIFPTLLEGVKERKPGCARWLGCFRDLLIQCPEAEDQLPEHLQSPRDLLSEALLLDPHDEIARRYLIDMDVRYFEYVIHELPWAVLYGANGATAAECEELLVFLADFTEQVKLAGLYAKHQDLIRKCSFHFVHYRNYLLAGRLGGSYELYVLQLMHVE